MKYLLIVMASLFIGFLIGAMMMKTEKKLDSAIYIPGEYKVQRSAMEILGLARVRRNSKVAKEKSYLKQLGTTVAMYYTDGGSTAYPENLQNFDFDISLFRPRHLRGKYIELPENWKLPNNWESYNQSNTPFIFVRSPEDNYKGSAKVPMFITRNGYQAGKGLYQLVYEDGHVSTVSKDEAIKLWKKAGVWNDLD